MVYILRYLSNMTPFIIVSLPYYYFSRYLIYKKTNVLNRYREVGMFLFVMFLVGLASQTVIPKLRFSFYGGIKIISSYEDVVNLIPFKVFFDSYKEVLNGRYVHLFIYLFGNIAVFMPVGFFIPLLWRVEGKRVILIGTFTSVFIETVQLLLPRETDIDDVILNVLGTIFGLLVYRLLLFKHKKFCDRFKKTEVLSMKRVYDFLKLAQTYYIATVEGGCPKVRPFGTINIFEDKLYIQTGKRKDISKQIAENPNVEICAMNGGEWIRVSGTLVNDDRLEAKRSMLDAYPELQSMYKADDDNTQVLYFKDATAVIYSFTSEPEKIEF